MNQNCRARFPNGPDKRAVWETAPTFYDQNRSIWVLVLSGCEIIAPCIPTVLPQPQGFRLTRTAGQQNQLENW